MPLQFAYGVMICVLAMSVYHPLSYTVQENLLLEDILYFCEAREAVIFKDFNLPPLL